MILDPSDIKLIKKGKTVPLGGGARRELYVGTHKEKGGKYFFRRSVGAKGSASWKYVGRDGGTVTLTKDEAEPLEAQVSA